MTKNKSAAQTLFDRIMVTWMYPELQRRVQQGLVTGPFPLTMALILCKGAGKFEVQLNDEVRKSARQLEVVCAEPIVAGQNVLRSAIGGLKRVVLLPELRNYPFVFMAEGKEGKFYLLSRKMSGIVGNREFEILANSLATDGVVISPAESEGLVYFDMARNQYDGMPSATLKRRVVKQLADARMQWLKRQATVSVKRHLRLPTIIIHPEDEFLLLLVEVRETYVDGRFFSSIASAATTADRICNCLAGRYRLPAALQKWVLDRTLGQKISKLRAEGVITKDQESLLVKMNTIRTRHLHPRKAVSPLSLKRDAFVMIRLLHELLEGTFGVMKDHTFHEGRLVPKPLI